MGSQRVNKQSQDFEYHQERLFPTQFCSQLLINMEKILSFRFQQYLGPFTMLHLEGSSETGRF